MAIEAKVHRCEEDDPKRCQAMAGKGQCPYLAVDGSSYCPLHSGGTNKKAIKEEIDQYRLNGYQQRLRELSNHSKVKTLRDEIAMLRMVLETVWNTCNAPADVYLQSGKISELAVKLEKLIVSCNTIEHKNGMMLDKTELLKMVDSILGILTKHIDDSDTLRSISDEVFGLFSES